jgi:hypothetical protein
MCVLIFSANSSEIFFILRRIERDIIIDYIGIHLTFPLLLPDFNQT